MDLSNKKFPINCVKSIEIDHVLLIFAFYTDCTRYLFNFLDYQTVGKQTSKYKVKVSIDFLCFCLSKRNDYVYLDLFCAKQNFFFFNF